MGVSASGKESTLAAEITGLAVEYDLLARVEIPVLIIVGCNEVGVEGQEKKKSGGIVKKKKKDEKLRLPLKGYVLAGYVIDRLILAPCFASIVSCSVAPSLTVTLSLLLMCLRWLVGWIDLITWVIMLHH